MNNAYATAFELCADDLEAALSEAPMPLTTTVTDWIGKELAADPVFAQDVEAELEAMRVEQAQIAEKPRIVLP